MSEPPNEPPYQPPYGEPYPAGPPGPYKSPPQSPWVGILIGALVIGPVLGVVGPVAVIIAFSGAGVDSGWVYFLGAVLVPLLFPAVLLFFRPTRSWGIGIMIGAALTSIVLAGACVAILDGLSNA